MASQQLTPPVPTKLFNFDEAKFSKTLKRLTPELIKNIKIGVWVLDPSNPRGCIDILSSDLSGKELDDLIANAKYTTYTGSWADLSELGVL